MRTQKRTFLGIDITKRKALYAEIDALTEENREQAAEIGKLREKIDEQAHTIMAHRNRINLLNSDNSDYYQTIKSQKNRIDTIKAKATEFEEKYNAAVKYQQNTQAAYDELKAEYDTARVIGFKQSPKQAQPRGKNGRFEKSKRADDPRK